jgi:hypothetical protein
MNKILKHKYLPWLVSGLGGIAMALQFLMMRTKDESGLITSGYSGHIIAWILAVIAALLICMTVPRLKGPNRYKPNFPPSLAGAVGAFVAAAGIGISLVFFAPGSDILALLWRILGILSVFSLVITGLCRMSGGRPAFFFHGVICLFFALHLVCCCRIWSSESQPERYSFALLANIGLMLTGYYRAAFDAGIGTRRMQLCTGLATCFFCLAAVPTVSSPLLYLTGAAWAVTNLCVLRTFKRRPRPAPAPES